MTNSDQWIVQAVQHDPDALLQRWVGEQLASATFRRDLIGEAELRMQSQDFLRHFTRAVQSGALNDVQGEPWTGVRAFLESLSRQRAAQGFTFSEVATFVFSFKQPLFERLRADTSIVDLAEALWTITTLLDRLGLYTVEVYQRSRETIIERQRQEMLELSTPVVKVWEGVVALPLIGTLDSERTQIVMETLLTRIVETSATIAIIDITGVPTVDTLVAQHLLRTVAAAQLMGTECIISGIRPQIAQTIVHLGIDLSGVLTKASLADAIQVAMERSGFRVARGPLA
ncbi:STAS domain-containing protein [Deinococcus yavapaiensis]|uniref:RsbT co-antagonist protein RsbR n=1 Tax=Deinococcus yavapaiensis KR-236 TaxID=694435 RepID=A0A318S7E9_9DEIO|nr:STAS domain-containing protein [Deinococcus yavapaiensis]PYE53816.1 rsbT co-antagonist protein RsbR [Deinococcus yavapaiensis KR-236]